MAFGAILCPILLLSVVLVTGSTVAAEQNRVNTAQPIAMDRFAQPHASEAADSGGFLDAYVYRFDAGLEAFEVFTIPTRGASPHSIAAVPRAAGQEVWFTEPGADQIARLVYTATGVFALDEFEVGVGGEPLNLAVDEARNIVWFTERSGNRIGSLEIGSQDIPTYVSYDVPTANSQPTDVDLAPNEPGHNIEDQQAPEDPVCASHFRVAEQPEASTETDQHEKPHRLESHCQDQSRTVQVLGTGDIGPRNELLESAHVTLPCRSVC